jgi:ProQ/FINO family
VFTKTDPGAGNAGAAEHHSAHNQECAGSTESSPKLQASTRALRRPNPEITACIQLLAELFPRSFAVHEARRQPLKVGIRDEIIAALDGAVTAVELGRALSKYTSNKVYRARLRAGAIRIDLNGGPAGVVTFEQAQPFVARTKS